MAGFGNTISDMAFNVTNGTINQGLATALNDLEHLIIHGKHKGVKFYYDQTSGGGVIQVMTRALIGGAVSELGALAKNTFKDLLWSDDKVNEKANPWHDGRVQARKREQDEARRNNENGKYGAFPVNNGANFIYAGDQHGYYCEDALMLGIPLAQDKKVRFYQNYRRSGSNENNTFVPGYTSETGREHIYKSQEFDSDHLVWWDCTAIISVDSQKNLVVTPVQGRDYSRKELVSNGDINIRVSGQITSLYPDIYPFEEVKKLRQILRYKGIIEINSQILDSWDIDKIIIKDFDFPQEEGGKAVQKYSFTAVAVQPAKLAEVQEDTIRMVTQPFVVEEPDEDSKWSDLLKEQFERLKRGAAEIADTGVSVGSDLLINDLLNKSI